MFSDILGGGVHRWSPGTGEVSTVVPKRRGVGGMVRHADGGLVLSGRDVIHVPARARPAAGHERVRAEGWPASTTSPSTPTATWWWGGCASARSPASRRCPASSSASRPTAATSAVLEGVLWANGCAFSPDGGTFYGCDYHRGLVLAAERRDDGTYGPRRVVAVSPSGDADGMAVDETGALWVALGRRRHDRPVPPRRPARQRARRAGPLRGQPVLRRQRRPRPVHHHPRQHRGPAGGRSRVRADRSTGARSPGADLTR